MTALRPFAALAVWALAFVLAYAVQATGCAAAPESAALWTRLGAGAGLAATLGAALLPRPGAGHPLAPLTPALDLLSVLAAVLSLGPALIHPPCH